jgi:hypothetical protein
MGGGWLESGRKSGAIAQHWEQSNLNATAPARECGCMSGVGCGIIVTFRRRFNSELLALWPVLLTKQHLEYYHPDLLRTPAQVLYTSAF